MQTTKAKKQVAVFAFIEKWKALDYLRASLCLPFIAIGISSLHPLFAPMLISFIGLGLVTIITNILASCELNCGTIRTDNIDIAKRVPLAGLPLLGIAVIGFLIGSMFWMGLGLSFLILFGFPAVVVFASFGHIIWARNSSLYYGNSCLRYGSEHQFTMQTCFHYSALIGFSIAAVGGGLRLVPIAIQVQ